MGVKEILVILNQMTSIKNACIYLIFPLVYTSQFFKYLNHEQSKTEVERVKPLVSLVTFASSMVIGQMGIRHVDDVIRFLVELKTHVWCPLSICICFGAAAHGFMTLATSVR